MANKKPIKIAIAGASGYLGGELLRLLLPRGDVKVTAIASQSNAGKALGDLHPHLSHISNLKFTSHSPAQMAKENDAIFFALPHGVSQDAVASAYSASSKCKLIDLSGDFRLPEANVYEKYYKTAHKHPQLLSQAVYGLPELGAFARKKIRAARLLASPGCFSTTSILAIRPFAAAGLIDDGKPVIVDAITGSSGSGTHPSVNTHHPTRFADVRAYEIFTHRHTPEISNYGGHPNILFTPHSGPWVRGIYATAYVPLKKEMNSAQAQALLSKHYRGEYFIRVVPQVHLAWTAQTNFAHLSASASGKTAIVTAALDNLCKGGAGQAVQSFNLAFGLDEKTGLQQLAAHP